MDKGHENLIQDLEALLKEAKEFQFHDFENTDYAMPKVELVKHFQAFIEVVKNGGYDN